MNFASQKFVVIFIALMCGLLIAEDGITITETRLENGDSVIKVVNDIRGITKNYKINMSEHHYPAASADDELVKKFESWKFGAFISYNSNQYSGLEHCTSTNPADFTPTNLDMSQWISAIKDIGMNYAVLTVRHTSKFLLWDSLTSEIKVTNSPYEKDVVKEYVEECRRQGIAIGIYYCLWGGPKWNTDPNARAVILAQLHELAAQYGFIDYFWLDMPGWIGWLTPDLKEREIYDSIKNVSPRSIVMFNHGIQDGRTSIYPTDVVNGEIYLPPAQGYNPWRENDGRKYYIPFEYETCSQKRTGRFRAHVKKDFHGAAWFTYGEGKDFIPSKPLSAEFMYKLIDKAYKRGASNVLLSCAPDYTGAFRKDDLEQLVKLGKMLKDSSKAPPKSITEGGKASSSGVLSGDYSADMAFDDDTTTRWECTENSKQGWLGIDLGAPRKISKVTIDEAWDRVRKFELQIKKNGQWATIYEGTLIGLDFSAVFEPVVAQEIRLNIIEAIGRPAVWEFQLFASDWDF